MPKFKGDYNPEEYLKWALKVDKIFRVHNFSEAKKVAMASLEFEEYANVWWEKVVQRRDENLEDPIDTWEEMKEVMHARFVPEHYAHDLFHKLTKLTQGTKSVEDYYKEIEIIMMRAHIDEDEENTIARFLNGLNYPIQKIVEFQPYTTIVQLVHQATKAERQVKKEAVHERAKAYYAARSGPNASSSSPMPQVTTHTKQAQSTLKPTSAKAA